MDLYFKKTEGKGVREKINMEKNGMKVIVTIRRAMVCRNI
jgi:hypothetical protein